MPQPPGELAPLDVDNYAWLRPIDAVCGVGGHVSEGRVGADLWGQFSGAGHGACGGELTADVAGVDELARVAVRPDEPYRRCDRNESQTSNCQTHRTHAHLPASLPPELLTARTIRRVRWSLRADDYRLEYDRIEYGELPVGAFLVWLARYISVQARIPDQDATVASSEFRRKATSYLSKTCPTWTITVAHHLHLSRLRRRIRVLSVASCVGSHFEWRNSHSNGGEMADPPQR